MTTLAKIFELEESIRDMEEAQIKLEPEHYFTEGMYLRELFIPEGVVVVGEMHKHHHFVIVAEGVCKIVSEEGEFEVEAPFVFCSEPFAKRTIYAITDTTLMNVHLNLDNEKEIEKVENKNVYKDPSELLDVRKKLGVI